LLFAKTFTAQNGLSCVVVVPLSTIYSDTSSHNSGWVASLY